MDWWSVRVQAQTDGNGLIDDEAIAKFRDLTQPYDGSITADGQPPHWDATMNLEAASAADAVTEAVRIVTLFAADAGLPVWPVVRAEAVRQDVRDAEVS